MQSYREYFLVNSSHNNCSNQLSLLSTKHETNKTFLSEVFEVAFTVLKEKGFDQKEIGFSNAAMSFLQKDNKNETSFMDASFIFKQCNVNNLSQLKVKLNDNYCDCNNGFDEPGTGACSSDLNSLQSMSQFHCFAPNRLLKKVCIGRSDRYHIHLCKEYEDINRIPTSKVGDMICDCCDCSDEWMSSNQLHSKVETCLNQYVSLTEKLNVQRIGSEYALENIFYYSSVIRANRSIVRRTCEDIEYSKYLNRKMVSQNIPELLVINLIQQFSPSFLSSFKLNNESVFTQNLRYKNLDTIAHYFDGQQSVSLEYLSSEYKYVIEFKLDKSVNKIQIEARQENKLNNNKSGTILGKVGNSSNDFLDLVNGDKCFNGLRRKTTVKFRCSEKEVKIMGVTEPSSCFYDFMVATPIACLFETL